MHALFQLNMQSLHSLNGAYAVLTVLGEKLLDAELLLLGEGEEALNPILAKQKLLYVERQLLTTANTKDIVSTLNSFQFSALMFRLRQVYQLLDKCCEVLSQKDEAAIYRYFAMCFTLKLTSTPSS